MIPLEEPGDAKPPTQAWVREWHRGGRQAGAGRCSQFWALACVLEVGVTTDMRASVKKEGTGDARRCSEASLARTRLKDTSR